MNVVYEIVSKIADREGINPTELNPPLSEIVNVEALEALIDGSQTKQGAPCPLVEFEYDGYTVKIGEDGNVHVNEAVITDDFSVNKSDSSQENIPAKLGHHEAMKDVADVISARDRAFTKRLDGLLGAVRKELGVESGTLSYVNDGTYVFEAVDATDNIQIHAGEVISLDNTVCERVVETEQTLVLSDVDEDAQELASSDYEVSSYLGFPVFVDGEVYGTLCFYNKDLQKHEFSEWDYAFVELLSNWVSSELARRQRERALHASTTERPYAAN